MILRLYIEWNANCSSTKQHIDVIHKLPPAFYHNALDSLGEPDLHNLTSDILDDHKIS